MPEAATVLTIDLLRHGATVNDGSVHGDNKLFGSTDIPLSEQGEAQLLQAAQAIHQEPVTHIVSSPLQRCRWLAEQQFSHLAPEIDPAIDSGFAEMDFGQWEGMSLSQLQQETDYTPSQMSSLTPPGGESFADFSDRIKKKWGQYTDLHLDEGGHHLLISHAGVIRVILGMVLHIPDAQLHRLYIPHASWSRITMVRGQSPIVWFINKQA